MGEPPYLEFLFLGTDEASLGNFKCVFQDFLSTRVEKFVILWTDNRLKDEILSYL